MSTRFVLCLLVVGLGGLVQPPPADGDSCGGPIPSSVALGTADVVFVGRVARIDEPPRWRRVNPDGSVSVGGWPGPPVAVFEDVRVFRGRAVRQMLVVGRGVPFKAGEAWLVYASVQAGAVRTSPCSRTRLLTEASQDIAYLEGLEQQRQQGIVYGEVHRRVVGTGGEPVLRALFEPLQVVAVGAGRRVEVTTDRWGPYQLVLPPGEFEIWVERAGLAVAPRQTVRVEDEVDRRIALIAEYND